MELANEAGIYVLFDMHAPQGGYQSDKQQGFAAFWGNSSFDPNTDNQNRLIALWTAIANRYKHETAVAGYDLINEPRPHNSEEWYSYAEQIIAAIRSVDAEHLIVVEVPFIPNYTIRTVNDSKVMYDAHFYTPWEYAIQYSASYGNAGEQWGKYDPANPVYVKYIDGNLTVVPQGTPGSEPFNKSYLQNALQDDILNFANTNNVPVDVGEFGLSFEAFNFNVGSLTYMEDIMGIFDGDNPSSMQASRFYFSFHGSPFSIYTNWNGFQRNETDVNTALRTFFINYTPGSVLPVELVSFTAICCENKICMKWVTSNEINNKHFMVERSPDGKVWQKIGQVDGAGDFRGIARTYFFLDESLRNGIVYYRLKQTDMDGGFTYSQIISIEVCPLQSSVEIYPNPATDGIYQLKIWPQSNVIQYLDVFSAAGKEVLHLEGDVRTIDLSNMADSVYFILIHFSKGSSQPLRVLKR